LLDNYFIQKNEKKGVLGLSFKKSFWTFINVLFLKTASEIKMKKTKKVTLLGDALIFRKKKKGCDHTFF